MKATILLHNSSSYAMCKNKTNMVKKQILITILSLISFVTIINAQNKSIKAQGFGHMGYNGSVAWCDPARQLSFAFVHNFDVTMLNDIRQFALTEALLSMIEGDVLDE